MKDANTVAFKPNKEAKDGLSSNCRVCHRVIDKNYQSKRGVEAKTKYENMRKQNKEQKVKPKYTEVSLSQVIPDPNQPRQEFSPHDLLRLRSSIEREGIISPLIVEKRADGKYLIIDGERRYRASKALKLTNIPVLILNEMSEQERLVNRFHLQEQHVGWSSFDKARAIIGLQESTGMSVYEIAEFLGVAKRTVEDYMSLMSLSKRTREVAVDRRLPFSYLSSIGRTKRKLESPKLQAEYEDAILQKIEEGIVKGVKDIQRYHTAVQFGGEEIAKKIANKKDYTPAQALKDAKADIILARRAFVGWLGYVTRLAEDGLKHGLHNSVSRDDVDKMIAHIDVVQKVINKSGGN